MTPTQSDRLMRSLERCGAILASKVSTSTLIRGTPIGDDVMLQGPALHTDLMLDDEPVDNLARDLYGAHEMSYGAAEYVWRRCCTIFRSRHERHLINPTIATIFPTLPLCEGGTYVTQTMSMVQYIKALHWTFGELKLDFNTCLLSISPHTVIGWVGQGVEFTPDDYRRFPELYCTDYRLALQLRLSEPHPAHPLTGGVYRHLVKKLPELAPQIDLIFGAAVHASPVHEARLINLFNAQL